MYGRREIEGCMDTHQNQFCVLDLIKEVVGIKLAGIKNVADDSVNRRLCNAWSLSEDMFALFYFF